MEINLEKTKVPNVTFKTRVYDENVEGDNKYKWKDLTSAEIFNGKKVVLFGLPGAFTPTCSSTHLPVYDMKYNEFKSMGIDNVICVSVNDAFVMFNWAKHLDIKNVFMLPDGNGDWTRSIGMMVKKENLGFGDRSWRYSMYIQDGMIEKVFIEPGFSDNCPTDPFEVSDCDTMLNYLKTK